jgi:hypothetical protein
MGTRMLLSDGVWLLQEGKWERVAGQQCTLLLNQTICTGLLLQEALVTWHNLVVKNEDPQGCIVTI